jgi:xanthine dehydrogenase accessory factor
MPFHEVLRTGMRLLLSSLLAEIEAGRTAALATVVDRQGSAAGVPGWQMLVRQDGSFANTVGGGLVESQVLTAARAAMAEGRASLHSFDLSGASGPVCGGRLDIVVEPFPPARRAEVEALHEAIGPGGCVVFAPRDARDPAAGLARAVLRDGRWVWQSDGFPAARFPAPALAAPAIQARRVAAGDTWFLLVPFERSPTVWIFGAGHVGQATAALAAATGFRVVVADDRPEFANRERFPAAAEIVVADLGEAAERIADGPRQLAVIVTRDHHHDFPALTVCLRKGVPYIGVIGSRRKAEVVFNRLASENWPSELMARVKCPIGLPIGSRTPQECAVSIVAELIQERNKLQQAARREAT